MCVYSYHDEGHALQESETVPNYKADAGALDTAKVPGHGLKRL